GIRDPLVTGVQTCALPIFGVTIDEGIASYRPQGIDYARRLCARLGIEHRLLAYTDTVGHAMDDVVVVDPEAIPCSYCGPFRRERSEERRVGEGGRSGVVAR